MKLDMNQQAREFLDQTVRDLHMAGYPERQHVFQSAAASIQGGGRTGKRFTHARFCWKATSTMMATSTA